MCLAVAACLAAGALPAAAQKDSILTVGVAASIYRAPDNEVEDPTGFGLVARLRRPSGIGFTVGLDWFTANVRAEIGGIDTPLASLKIRPVMAGYGLTRQYSDFSVTASVVAGYAFNSISRTGAAQDAYANRLGLQGTRFEVSNCLAVRPDFSIWWELGNRWGLLTSVSYMYARPTITTTTPLGASRRTVNASSPMLTVGIGYGVF